MRFWPPRYKLSAPLVSRCLVSTLLEILVLLWLCVVLPLRRAVSTLLEILVVVRIAVVVTVVVYGFNPS